MTVSLRLGSGSTLMEKEVKKIRNSGAVLPGPLSSFLSGAWTDAHTLVPEKNDSLYYGPQPDGLPGALKEERRGKKRERESVHVHTLYTLYTLV